MVILKFKKSCDLLDNGVKLNWSFVFKSIWDNVRYESVELRVVGYGSSDIILNVVSGFEIEVIFIMVFLVELVEIGLGWDDSWYGWNIKVK